MVNFIKIVLFLTIFAAYHANSIILRLGCKSYADFSISLDGMVDSGSVLKDLTSRTRRQCILECISLSDCKSVNHKSADLRCQLLEREIKNSTRFFIERAGWKYITTDDEDQDAGATCKKLSPCQRGTCKDTCQEPWYKCTCDKYYYGARCAKPIQDCTSVYKSGSTQDGVYNIYVSRPGISIKVYCDMTANNDGWIVIQRRVDSSTDFYRNWAAYKQGFGDLSGNMWIGLDNLHILAGPDRKAILRVDLKHRSTPDQKYYAEYTTFEVGNEASKYKLLIGGYSGNASNSMQEHNGMKFTTYDRDNDATSIENCAVSWKGAWWYNGCHWVNLNGLYPTAWTTSPTYMSWLHLKGTHGNIFFSEMKLKYH